jgi:MoaA/NifB/PqqE/SkfB family radical SAM enzyme
VSPFEENLALARREFRDRPLALRSKPTFLGVVLTTRCHLDCVMCHRVRVKGELPPGFLEKLRPLLPYLEQLHWQGGEVFLVPEFEALFEESAARAHLTQFIVTAGLLIDRAWAARLARARCGLTFSVDSAAPATYAAIRKGGALEQVEQALAYLAEAGFSGPKTLHAVAMEENAGDVSSVVDFALRHGMRHVDITPRLPIRFAEEKEGLRRQLELARAHADAAGLSLTDRVTSVLGFAGPQKEPPEYRDCRNARRGGFVKPQ